MNLTKLEATNRILESIGMKPVPSIGANDESGDAERMLDIEHKVVLMEGHYANRTIKEYTAADNKIVLTDVLAVKSAGRDRFRNFEIRKVSAEYLLYDIDMDTTTITTGTKYWVEVTTFIAFADLPLSIQNIIIERTRQNFARVWGNNTELLDQQATERRVRAEAIGLRASGRAETDRSGPGPFLMQQPERGDRR